jgi:8-oxo-dGTP pyrophosphatase MutT (NUDIX family)
LEQQVADYPAGVKIVVFRKNGDMLALRRGKDHPTKPLGSDLPGGLIEKGEPEVTAAVRELQEETGISADQKDLRIFYAASFVHPISRKVYSVLYYQLHLEHDPILRLSFEHESCEWCTVEDFLKREDLEDRQRQAIEFGVSHQQFISLFFSERPFHG